MYEFPMFQHNVLNSNSNRKSNYNSNDDNNNSNNMFNSRHMPLLVHS